jgi:hypothetical protein
MSPNHDAAKIIDDPAARLHRATMMPLSNKASPKLTRHGDGIGICLVDCPAAESTRGAPADQQVLTAREVKERVSGRPSTCKFGARVYRSSGRFRPGSTGAIANQSA